MRVLVIDDARMMRRIISDVVSDGGHTVVGEAADGYTALRMAAELEPDLITLDVEMPGMNGIEVLRRLMSESPTKVVLVSSLTTAGADVTLEGLALGAIDFIPKPSATTGLEGFGDQIRHVLSAARLARIPRAGLLVPPRPAREATSRLRFPSLIAVATSTGGPQALTRFLGAFDAPPPAPMLIVQHMPPQFTGRLAQRLDSQVGFPVREAVDGEPIQTGTALVAPGDFHLGYRSRRVRLLDSPPVGRLRPAADVTFQEIAREGGRGVLAVVMTGMGRDGLNGGSAIVKAGGQLIAQNEESCAVDGMPKAVREAGLAVATGTPEDLAGLIERAAQRGAA